MSRRLRAAAAPVGLALARMRAAPARSLLAAAGIAVAVALLGVAAGGGAIAGEQAAQRLVRALPAADGRVQITWSGGLTARQDAQARRALTRMTGAPATSAVLLRPTRVATAGPLVQVAAIAPARPWLALESGRLPRLCTPARCEVVQVSGARAGSVRGDGPRLIVVGRGRLTSPVPLGFVPRPQPPGLSEQQRRPALLVAGDPRGLEGLPALGGVYRTHGWSAPLDVEGTPSWRLDRIAARIRGARAALESSGAGWTVRAPLGALAAARERATTARERVTLVASGAAVLLAAFLLLAAGALGRDLRAERGRLERRGARRGQLALLAAAEAAVPAAAGVVAGAAVALAVTWLRARAADLDAGALVAHALLTPRALAAAAVAWALATVLLSAGAIVDGRAASRAADAAALVAGVAVVVAVARGGVSAGDVAGGADPLPALLPALVCLAAGLVVLRAAGPVLRAGARASRRAPAVLRTAALGIARAPGQAALTVAFVAVAGGLALFAAGYRATLTDGQRDEAAFRVPVDVTVAAGADFVSPLRLDTPAGWRDRAGGGTALAVVRQSGSVPRGSTRVTLPVLGVPASGLGDLRGWSRTGASASAAALAARLAPPAPAGGAAPAAPRLPAGARTVAVRAHTRGDALRLTLHVRTPTGVASIPLGLAGPQPATLRARVPPAARGGVLVGLEAQPDAGLLATQGHALAENPAAPAVVRGSLVLGPLTAGATTLDTSGWRAQGALRDPAPRRGAPAITVPYAFDRPGAALLRPPAPTDGRPLPVLTDPATAAAAGPGRRLPLTVDGVSVTARVAGTLERLPGIPVTAAGFVVADAATLTTVLDAGRPGAGNPTELWLAVSRAQEARLDTALARPRLAGLTVTSRRAVERRLRADPLARELVRVLAAAAIVGGALAVAGLLLATAVALRDDAAELYDLEAQGTPPAALRRTLWLRGVLLALLGAAGAVALALILDALVVDTIRATAATAVPHPPLAAATPWAQWALGAAAFVVVAALAVRLALARSFAGPTPRRPRSAAP